MASRKINIVEVGLRDGLQNETQHLSLEDRLSLATRLSQAGIRRMEIGAFVSPKWVPTMADSDKLITMVFAAQNKQEIARDVQFSALVPNIEGMQKAIASKVKEIAIFAACSETFSHKNINCSIDESFERFEPVVREAKKHKIKVRGYLSTCFGCPYEGPVAAAVVVKNAQRMLKMGAYEVSIGDTIGVATPKQTELVFKKLLGVISEKKLAGHFHDTRGQALANILQSLKMGISTFDSSIGGLGGCPYAKGATGNVATEDVVYMLNGMGFNTGIDLQSLIECNHWLSQKMGKPLPSRVSNAGL